MALLEQAVEHYECLGSRLSVWQVGFKDPKPGPHGPILRSSILDIGPVQARLDPLRAFRELVSSLLLEPTRQMPSPNFRNAELRMRRTRAHRRSHR